MIGSSSLMPALWAASRIAPRAQISNASAEESTSWYLPSVRWTSKSMIGKPISDPVSAVSRRPFSTAMLTEGIHSVVDSTNQLLLVWGRKASRRSPNELHPFGYGREIYFWSFVVAVLVF